MFQGHSCSIPLIITIEKKKKDFNKIFLNGLLASLKLNL